MRSRIALLCAAAVAAALLVGCSPGIQTKYDVARNLQKDQQYAAAVAKFGEFVNENKESTLVPYAMYFSARSYEMMYDKTKAMAAYKEVVEKFPVSEPAKWAEADMRDLEKRELTPPPAPVKAPEKKMPQKKAPEKKMPEKKMPEKTMDKPAAAPAK